MLVYYKMSFFRLCFGVLVLVLFGCASPDIGKTFEENTSAPDKDKAMVYLYRSNMFDLKGAAPEVFVDDEPKGKLMHATYRLWLLDDGQYEVVIKAGDFFDEVGMLDKWKIRARTITLDVKSGEVYFVRLKPSVSNNTLDWRDAKLTFVEEKDALKEISTNTLDD